MAVRPLSVSFFSIKLRMSGESTNFAPRNKNGMTEMMTLPMKKMGRMAAVVVGLLLTATAAWGQRVQYEKLSPMLRKMVRSGAGHQRSVYALVKTSKDDVLPEKGCRVLAQVGDISIADIPVEAIGGLTADKRIVRIEASTSTLRRGKWVQTDTLAQYLNALPVYDGQGLPQAFTGRDVVVGVMDIGFDLTHPNFYSRDTTEYRIRRFWDMLSADTVGSRLPVGRDYSGRDELLALGHARDGLKQTHGTHTLGIAAGSGYNSPYRGLAPESDICLVANAVTEDTVFIDPADYDKYSFALDALGFKYIFDYAESVGKPCVINFSEGSKQDFWGGDVLYYELLSRLVGPGRILVSSAGNYGGDNFWMCKRTGTPSAGTFFRTSQPEGMLTLKSASHFGLRLVGYANGQTDTLMVSTADVVTTEDSTLATTFYALGDSISVKLEGYPSCYNADEMCYDLTLGAAKRVGTSPRLSVEVLGIDADVEVFLVSGTMETNPLNPTLIAAQRSHSVLSPATAPCMICVGATYYRQGITNYLGEWKTVGGGSFGEWGTYSSVGPTYDGRIKPDVLAPGSNIISSYSSFYLENHPDANDIKWDVAHFDFNGRTYAWNSNTGTSMSSPAVAGAIALWMQAKPDLTMEEVMDVFAHTCHRPDAHATYPNNRYGWGEIDVYAGLLYLLGADQIEGVSTRHTKARIACADGRLTIDLGQGQPAPVGLRLFSLKGVQLLQAQLPAGQARHSLSLPALSPGIYVVQLSEGGSTLIRIN